MSWLICEGLIKHGRAKDKVEINSFHEIVALAMYNELLDAAFEKFLFVLMRMFTDECFL